jgi:hypothetical protein
MPPDLGEFGVDPDPTGHGARADQLGERGGEGSVLQVDERDVQRIEQAGENFPAGLVRAAGVVS